jgi:hypothetical protein
MRRSQLSLATASLCLLGALVWLALGNVVSGLLWVVLSAIWLLIAILAGRQPDVIEPSPARRLLHRFFRVVLFWS